MDLASDLRTWLERRTSLRWRLDLSADVDDPQPRKKDFFCAMSIVISLTTSARPLLSNYLPPRLAQSLKASGGSGHGSSIRKPHYFHQDDAVTWRCLRSSTLRVSCLSFFSSYARAPISTHKSPLSWTGISMGITAALPSSRNSRR